MNKTIRMILAALALAGGTAMNAADYTTLRIDAAEKHQRITGFGAFVCSPSFGYNHMSTTEIQKVWGPTSTLGCNIMRLYIPVGEGAWGSSLATAKLARQMGLTVFASPWGQPAEWKTNNTSNAKNDDGTLGSLKPENYGDYAEYLNNYATYLKDNGAALDAISIQNEPDMPATYAGCMWTPNEIATFLKEHRSKIDCPVIAAESVGMSDSYANALYNSQVLPHFDIYGGHQYGGLQSAFKKFAAKGKEIWQTEYLINWQEIEGSTRTFAWAKDAFNFANSINTCMLNDVNAWIHYAAKRFYALMGDGTNGTTNGTITKRGYIMGQFSKHVTGMTRIGTAWTDNTSGLTGSAYLSQSGDTVVAVVINNSSDLVPLKFDLPFYTLGVKTVLTSQNSNMRTTGKTLTEETCRPMVNVAKSSVTTYVFVKSAERAASAMTAQRVNFDMIEGLTPTKTTFGTAYKMTGKTLTFDHSHSLISGNTAATNGALALPQRYDRLVMHVNSVSSAYSLTSDNTTLYYINSAGEVSSHNYGKIEFTNTENFDLVFDLSPATLTDGCTALLSISNSNWNSVLTLKLGNVYLQGAEAYGMRLSGAFSTDDSNWLDCMENDKFVWAQLPADNDAPAASAEKLSANRNLLVYLTGPASSAVRNTVVNGRCESLALNSAYNFRTLTDFTATTATLDTEVNGWRMIAVPFATTVPEGVEVSTLNISTATIQASPLAPGTAIAAHTPLLVKGSGRVTFTGTGTVSGILPNTDSALHPAYCATPLYAGDYILKVVDGAPAFEKLTAASTLSPFDVYLEMDGAADLLSLDIITAVSGVKDGAEAMPKQLFDVLGRKVSNNYRGIVTDRNARKYLLK